MPHGELGLARLTVFSIGYSPFLCSRAHMKAGPPPRLRERSTAMWNRSLLILALLLLAGANGAVAKSSSPAIDRPRLVVLISIDQFRADYLTRFSDLYLPPGDLRKPGGFRYLM